MKDKYANNFFLVQRKYIISVKGSLKPNLNYWKSVGASQKVLDVIEEGYKIPFVETPETAEFKNNKSSLLEKEFVTESVFELLKNGCILETTQKSKVINPLSVSKNSVGKKRLILDLRYVNNHLAKDYIKFDDWKDFQNYLGKTNFCYKFDLKNGYHHVDIFEEHQTFLGFSWEINGQIKYFVFTKIIRPLVAYWHSLGIQICVYLDDGA